MMMKKLLVGIVILLFILQVNAQQKRYVTIQFAAAIDTPRTVYNSSTRTYQLTTPDTLLNHIFNKYAINIYGKKYPTVYMEPHPKAAALDRVFNINVTNIDSLYSDMVKLSQFYSFGILYSGYFANL